MLVILVAAIFKTDPGITGIVPMHLFMILTDEISSGMDQPDQALFMVDGRVPQPP